MPRIPLSITTPSDVQVGLWRMDESEDEILHANPSLYSLLPDISSMKSQTLRLERLAVAALLESMFGQAVPVEHNDAGRPFLDNGYEIGISHTRGYAVVIVSKKHNVAVDMEYMNDRVMRIARRFLREDESLTTVKELLLCWCAKETLYKLHSDDRLAFQEMRTHGIRNDGNLEGRFTIDNLKRGITVEMSYLSTQSYILTIAVEKKS